MSLRAARPRWTSCALAIACHGAALLALAVLLGAAGAR